MTSVTAPAPEPPPELHDVADEGDRPSITDAGGTVARFEMAYSPAPRERHAFRAPWRTALPSIVYLAFGALLVATVALAYSSSGNGRLYEWIVEGDRYRAVRSPVLAFMVLVSGLATLARSRMRGVIVHGDGVEMRDVLLFGLPTVRRWAWAQILRVIVDDTRARGHVALELWDGSLVRLPEVARRADLADMLERVAASRRIATTHLARHGR